VSSRDQSFFISSEEEDVARKTCAFSVEADRRTHGFFSVSTRAPSPRSFNRVRSNTIVVYDCISHRSRALAPANCVLTRAHPLGVARRDRLSVAIGIACVLTLVALPPCIAKQSVSTQANGAYAKSDSYLLFHRTSAQVAECSHSGYCWAITALTRARPLAAAGCHTATPRPASSEQSVPLRLTGGTLS